MDNESPYHRSLRNRVTEIRNLQSIITQINQLRILNSQPSIDIYPKTFHDCITSCYLFIFTPTIIFLLFSYCAYEIRNIKDAVLKGEFELTVKSLETNHFFVLYLVSFVLIFFSVWTFFLLILKAISSFEYFTIDSITLKQEDILYFNPCFFCVSMIFYNKGHSMTFFDIFLLLSYSSIVFLNFIFSKYGAYYFNRKLNAITNIFSKDTSSLITRAMVFFSLMIASNLFIMVLIGLILPWDQVEYSVIVLFRNVYLLLHQIQMFTDVWWKFKQLDSANCTNEKLFIKNQYSKLTIETIIQVAVIQQLLFVNVQLYRDAVYLVILCWSVILRGVVGIITIGVKFYELSTFLSNLEQK